MPSPGKSLRQRSCLPQFLIGLILVGILLVFYFIPSITENTFGSPNPDLSGWQRFRYGLELNWHADDLIAPLNYDNAEIVFIIVPGENAYQVSSHLEQSNLIRSARTFQIYLAWSGKDAYLLPGTYRLSSSLSALTIADLLQSAGARDISLSVLPGWRIEEIAATLPTTGLEISVNEFVTAAYKTDSKPELIPPGQSMEGYLFPGEYSLPRTTSIDQLIDHLIQEFQTQLTAEYRSTIFSKGLTLHEAITLASIIQREAVQESEMSTIASVFYNRLAIGMMLQADPTVQYAVGYDSSLGTWWKTPLGYTDLAFDSPYNSYLYTGLPPGPICNPGMAALTAVAYPEVTPFYYFQAECDGSGYHNFAETLEQHLENNCP